MRILITGATGSMAYYLAKYIKTQVKERHLAVGIGRSRISDAAANLDDYEQLDLYYQPTTRVTEYMRRIKPDIVFHLAAMANVRQSFMEPQKFFSNNAEGTLNLFDGIVRAGIKPRIVHCSSSEVYGNVPMALNPIREHEPFAPVNFYSLSKATQELVCQAYLRVHGLEFVVTRAFGYINPRRHDLVATALAKQIVRFERGEVKEIYHGNLDPVRSFCDARDIAEAYWLAATKCAPGAYNIGSDFPCSIRILASMLECASGHVELPMVEQESLRRPTDIFACWPDISKFTRETGWRPKIQLIESLKWLMEQVRK